MSNKIQDSYIENPSTSGGAKRTVKSIPDGTYTLLSSDKDKRLVFLSTCTITVPTGLDADEEYVIVRKGTGNVNVVSATGVTLEKGTGKTFSLAYQYAFASLINVGVNEYILVGELNLAV